MMGYRACRCGCGKPAKLVWYSEECRAKYRYLNGLSENQRRTYAKERTAQAKRVNSLPTHTVLATVHRLNEDEDVVEKQQEIITLRTPTYGIWSI